MKFFKDYTFSWQDIGILKFSILILGIYIGVRFPEVFVDWQWGLLIGGILGILYLSVTHWKQIF